MRSRRGPEPRLPRDAGPLAARPQPRRLRVDRLRRRVPQHARLPPQGCRRPAGRGRRQLRRRPARGVPARAAQGRDLARDLQLRLRSPTAAPASATSARSRPRTSSTTAARPPPRSASPRSASSSSKPRPEATAARAPHPDHRDVGRGQVDAARRRCAQRGHRTVDTDVDGWILADGTWDEPRIARLLDEHPDIVVDGTVENQGRFYDRFDHVDPAQRAPRRPAGTRGLTDEQPVRLDARGPRGDRALHRDRRTTPAPGRHPRAATAGARCDIPRRRGREPLAAAHGTTAASAQIELLRNRKSHPRRGGFPE